MNALDRVTERLDSVTEGLDRLRERQEALSHAVELLAHMQQRTEKEICRLGRYVRVIVIDHEERLLKLEGEDEDDQEELNVERSQTGPVATTVTQKPAVA